MSDSLRAVAALARPLLQYALIGFVAGGAVWCSCGALSAASNAFPPSRLSRDRRLRREVAGGLAEIEAYLREQAAQTNLHTFTDEDSPG